MEIKKDEKFWKFVDEVDPNCELTENELFEMYKIYVMGTSEK